METNVHAEKNGAFVMIIYPNDCDINKSFTKNIDWHITSKCNYRCKFCFIKGLEVGVTDILDSKTILDRLKKLKIEKINIVGGEPLLYPFTYDIIKIAKRKGFVTSITTNGSLLTKSKIKMFSLYLDWIGLPVDSKYENIEREMGRGCGKHVQNVLKISEIIKEEGIKLKINTTVTKLNFKENMKPFIRKLDPDMWGNFQVFNKKGQSDDNIRSFSITGEEFRLYTDLNKDIILRSGEKPVFERCEDMISYFMLSPDGDLLVNTNNIYERYPLEYVEDNKYFKCFISIKKYNQRNSKYQWN